MLKSKSMLRVRRSMKEARVPVEEKAQTRDRGTADVETSCSTPQMSFKFFSQGFPKNVTGG